MSPYGSSSPAFLTAGQSVDGLTVENMASEDESEKWSSAIVKLCKTSLWPLLLLLPVLPSPKLPPPSPGVTKTSKKLPSAPPTRPSPALLLTPLTHTHACTHLVLYKGETTEWLQLHKHNFWQHYCTLNPTVYCFFFFFFFFKESPYFCVFETLPHDWPADTISQPTERMGWCICSVFLYPTRKKKIQKWLVTHLERWQKPEVKMRRRCGEKWWLSKKPCRPSPPSPILCKTKRNTHKN